jgi:hypothetical protein
MVSAFCGDSDNAATENFAATYQQDPKPNLAKSNENA